MVSENVGGDIAVDWRARAMNGSMNLILYLMIIICHLLADEKDLNSDVGKKSSIPRNAMVSQADTIFMWKKPLRLPSSLPVNRDFTFGNHSEEKIGLFACRPLGNNP